MECPKVALGGGSLQTETVVVNILNKQSRTADKWWSSSWMVGRGVKTYKKNIL
jgi:hypothetical protein